MIRFLRIGCNAGSVFSLQYVHNIERHFFAECLSYVVLAGGSRVQILFELYKNTRRNGRREKNDVKGIKERRADARRT